MRRTRDAKRQREALKATRLVVPAPSEDEKEKLLEDIAAVQHECDLIGNVAPIARKPLNNYLGYLRGRLVGREV